MSEEEARPGHEDDEHADDEHRPRTGLRRRLGRLLNQRELAEDTREVLGGMLDISDRAKTEAVRLVAREVRNYLDELRIMDDMKELVTSHSLEVRLSLNLKPLVEDQATEPAAPRKRAVQVKAAPAPEPEPAAPDDEDEESEELRAEPTEEAPA